MDRSQAQHRADAIAGFREEVKRLRALGLLRLAAEDQAAIASYHKEVLSDLGALYDVDIDPAEADLSWGMRLASTFAALVLAIGAVLAFVELWHRLATPVQLTVSIGSTLVLVGVAEAMWAGGRNGYFAGVAAFLAAAAFALNLFVLMRVFNLPYGLEAWLAEGLFVIGLAHRYLSRLLSCLGLALLVFWATASLAVGPSALPAEAAFSSLDPALPMAILIFLMGCFPGAPLAIAMRPAYRLAGLVCLTTVLVFLSNAPLIAPMLTILAPPAAYQLASLISAGALLWLGLARGWPETTYAAYALLFLTAVLRIYDWAWDSLPRFGFFLIMGVLSLALLWVLRTARQALRQGVARSITEAV